MYAVGTLLLVGLLVSLQSVSNIFAAPMQQGFKDSANCTTSSPSSTSSMTCCWREKIPGSILGEKYCQTCYYGPNGLLTSCDDKELQYIKTPSKDQSNTLPPLQGGGNVLQEPSTDSKLPQLLQKDGILEKLQESNTTLSKNK
jgi:hypothetical protein